MNQNLGALEQPETNPPAKEARLSQIKIVERAVRPLRTTTSEKRQIREELLAHLDALYEEERARLGDSAAALREAARRFGDPTELSRELQSSVRAPHRFGYLIERIFGWRAPESAARYLLRQAILSTLLVGVMFLPVAIVELRHSNWGQTASVSARALLLIMILVPIDQFVLGLLYYKLRNAMHGAFGVPKSSAVPKLYATAIGGVIALSLGALFFWGGHITTIPLTAATMGSVAAAIAYFRQASKNGLNEILDATWACLDLNDRAESAPASA